MEFHANVLENQAKVEAEDKNAAAALALVKRARELREALVESAPDDVGFQSQLAVTLFNQGAHQLRTNESTKAIDSLNAAREIQERLIENDTSLVRTRADLARTYLNLGICYRVFGQSDTAHTSFQLAVLELQKLSDRIPESYRVKTDLVRALYSWATLAYRTSKYDFAEDKLNESIEVIEEMIRDLKPSPAVQYELEELKVTSLELLAGISSESGMPRTAIRKFEQIEEIRAKHVEFTKGSRAARYSLAQVRYHLGRSLYFAYDEGDPKTLDRSLAVLKKSKGELESIRKDGGDSLEVVSLLSECVNVIGFVYQERDDFVKAKESFTFAVSLAEEQLEQDQSPMAHSQLGGHLNGLGNLLLATNEDERARKIFEKAIVHQTKALRAAPQVMHFRVYLANHHLGLGNTLVKLGHAAAAVKQFESRLELLPDNAIESYRASRSIAVCVALAKDDEMRTSFGRRSVEILESAVKQGLDPSVDIENDKAFAAVKSRDDFRSVVSSRKTVNR